MPTHTNRRTLLTCQTCGRRFRGQRSARSCSNACRQQRYREAAALRAAAAILTDWQASLSERGIDFPADLKPSPDDLAAFARAESAALTTPGTVPARLV